MPEQTDTAADALDCLALLREAITLHAQRHAGAADISLADLERLTKIYSALAKIEVEKRRINSRVELARLKRDEAQAKLDAMKAKANPNHFYGVDDEAPWGRKADGTPITREEFLTRLDQAAADIYGLDLKFGPRPVIKRFPGDHLPESQRTEENIALGAKGIVPPDHPCGQGFDGVEGFAPPPE